MTIAVVDTAELIELIAKAIASALEARANEASQPALLDRMQMAKYLNISATQLDRLRQQGLPYVKLGGASPRFRPAKCLDWLENRARNDVAPDAANDEDADCRVSGLT